MMHGFLCGIVRFYVPSKRLRMAPMFAFLPSIVFSSSCFTWFTHNDPFAWLRASSSMQAILFLLVLMLVSFPTCVVSMWGSAWLDRRWFGADESKHGGLQVVDGEG